MAAAGRDAYGQSLHRFHPGLLELAIERAFLPALPISLPGIPPVKATNAVPTPIESIQHPLSIYAASVEPT